MAIIDTFTESMFIERFERSETYKHNFTREALVAIFQHLEECSEGISLEFDLVGIACEYSELRGIDGLREGWDPAEFESIGREVMEEHGLDRDANIPRDLVSPIYDETTTRYVDYVRNEVRIVEFTYHDDERGFLLVE